MYTVEEVAQMLRVSSATVRRLIENGELKAIRVGKQLRISKEAFEDYKEKAGL